jgi:methylated-DNA-[protein]-cysteine S-methyltransferase
VERRPVTSDVAFATIESPVGALIAAITDEGLVALVYERGHREERLDELRRSVGPLREDPRRLDRVRRELDGYFQGGLRSFDLAIDWRLAPGGFMRRALEATARIPFGEVRTYRELAAAAGNRRASRAAGTAMARNPIAIVIPCHRAVRSDWTIGDYGGGPEGADQKEYLLRLEGAWPLVSE